MNLDKYKIIKGCDDKCKKCPKKDWCSADKTMTEKDKEIVTNMLIRAGVIK